MGTVVQGQQQGVGGESCRDVLCTSVLVQPSVSTLKALTTLCFLLHARSCTGGGGGRAGHRPAHQDGSGLQRLVTPVTFQSQPRLDNMH